MRYYQVWKVNVVGLLLTFVFSSIRQWSEIGFRSPTDLYGMSSSVIGMEDSLRSILSR